jgi:hypothetical protein
MSIAFGRPQGSHSVSAEVFVPFRKDLKFPFEIGVAADGHLKTFNASKPGRFKMTMPLGASAPYGVTTIVFRSRQSFVPDGVNERIRPVSQSFRLSSITFSPDKLGPSQSPAGYEGRP